MDLKEAYEIMELPENSSKEEVEKRFDILVRRMRRNTDEAEGNNSEEIIKAYNVIKEFARQATIDQYNVARFGTNIKKKERFEKMDRFWDKNRRKVIISVISIVVLAIVANIVVKSIKTAKLPKPALEIMMYGDYYGSNDDQLVKAILSKYPDWPQVKAIVNYLPGASASGGMDSAYVQKSFVMLATERPDVYILDKTTFKTMLEQNAISNIDAWKNELSGHYKAEQLLTGRQKDDTEDHLYGVDISDDPMWNTIGLPQGDKIAVLSTNLKHPENSKRFIVNFK